MEMSVFISASITMRPYYPGDPAPDTHWLGNVTDTRAVLVAVGKKSFLSCLEPNLDTSVI
jgi:hypothetical protein